MKVGEGKAQEPDSKKGVWADSGFPVGNRLETHTSVGRGGVWRPLSSSGNKQQAGQESSCR